MKRKKERDVEFRVMAIKGRIEAKLKTKGLCRHRFRTSWLKDKFESRLHTFVMFDIYSKSQISKCMSPHAFMSCFF